MAFKTGSEQRPQDVMDTISLEKEKIYQVEHGMSDQKRQYLRAGLSSEDADYLLDMTPKQQSAIYHKVDVRVVPMV